MATSSALRRRRSLLLALAAFLLIQALRDGVAVGQERLPDVAAIPPSVLEPGRADGRVAELWRRSLAFERAGDLDQSIRLRERILERTPEDVHTHWRIARDWFAKGERLPPDDPARGDAYERARDYARHGLALDPDCAECCAYDFLATTRMATTTGVLRNLPEMRAAAPILERCLAHPPTWADDELNPEAGNLYAGAAVYERLLPGSGVMAFVLGGRGDLDRAVALAEKAVALAPARIDYQVELGTALLCRGHRRDDPGATRRGRRALELARSLPHVNPWDEAEQDRATRLLTAPYEACDSARDVRME